MDQANAASATALPIIDAHQHIWRMADLPWLQGRVVPRIFGDYAPIRRDYPIEEYLDDIAGSGVVRSVYVQTNWPKHRAVEEARWVQSIADRHGFPNAIVGFADFTEGDVSATLKAHAQTPLVRGMRQQIYWHANPLYRFAASPDVSADPIFRRNLARLQDYGWLFELQVFEPQMASAAELARSLPGVTFVLVHAGMLEDVSPPGRARWREGMMRLAEQPNVHAKLSGLGTFLRANDPRHLSEIISATIEIFGPERCVWGSNFPIEKLWTSYADLVGTVRAVLEPFPQSVQRRVVHDNAAALYL